MLFENNNPSAIEWESPQEWNVLYEVNRLKTLGMKCVIWSQPIKNIRNEMCYMKSTD